MFKLCTILSLVCDVLIVTFFVVHPHLVEDKPSKDIEALFAIEHSFFPFILLAITRILCLIAFVQLYAVSAQLRNIHILYFWMSIHVVLSAITLIFMNYHDEFMIAKRLLVFASFVSIACQVVCIRHLRSSVLSIHCVALGLSDKLRNALKSQHHIYTESPDFNDDDEVKGNKLQGSSSTSFDIESSFSTPTKQRRVQRSLNNNRLLTSLRKKIKSANDAWNRQVFNLRRNISKGFTIIPTNRRNKRHHHDPLTSSQNIFQHILTLYIGESVSVQQQALAQLMEIFKSHPSLLEFYIPHIITYLLYGSFSIEELLMQRILYMCRMQLSFAIRMQWYVEAFILSNAQSIDGMDTLNELIREIASAGNEAYRRLEAVQEKDRQGYGSISDSHLIAGGEWKENWDVEMGPFSAETTFWLDLVDITKKIVHVPVAFRNVELRKLLQCEHFANTLQQQIIVLPWTSTTTKYRICHIHVEESFAFRTNERAPSLICLEVIPLHLPTTQLSERLGVSQQSLLRAASESEPLLSNQSVHTDDQDMMEGHEFERYNSRWNSLDFSSQISSLAHELHSLGDEDHNDANVEAEVAADLGQWSSPFLPRVRGARTTETPNEMYISPVRYSLANNSQLRETGEEDFDATTNLTFSEEALSQPSGSADKNIKKVVSLREVLDSPDSLTYSANGTPSTSTSIATMLEDIPTSSVTSAQGDNLKSAQKSLSLFLNGDEEDLDEDEYSEVSCIIFKEKWREKEKRIRKTSQYSHVKGWRLVPVIVKSNDDLRQEQLAGMLIKYMHTILQEARVDGYLHPYDIVALNADSGLIEAIPNTVSLDVIKKKEFGYHTLSNFFETFFGPVSTAETSRYCRATNNFIESIAAYSIVCYLLNVKDRHNGNILLTTHGHIIHIDFGFLLEKSPGGNIGFESAPFKLTSEYVDVMGGGNSKGFQKFRGICVRTFLELRRHYERILLLMEMMSKGNESLPCFNGDPAHAISEMRKRFYPDLHDIAAADMVNTLINQSLDNWTTTMYDGYQRLCQGIQ